MGDREELISKLDNVRNSYYLTLIFSGLLQSNDVITLLEGESIKIAYNGKEINLTVGNISEQFSNERYHDKTILALQKFGTKGFINETWKIIETYCEDNALTDLLENQPWYWFGYMIRCALAHNDRFRIRMKKETEKEVLPIKWKGKIIVKEMHDEPLTSDFFSPIDAFDLHEEIKSFVSQHIS